MSDNDLIRRGDALAAIQLGDTVTKLQARIRAIPAVDADPVCTDCGGSGITYQTERRCACQTSIPAVHPTVNPLVWRSNGKGRVCADTPFGLYEVEHGRYGMRLLHGGAFMQDDLQGIDAAKAAAQADYDARILSVLDMQPTVSPDVAALVEAAEKVINSYWHSTDGVITGIYDLEAALARVKGVM